MVKQQRPLRFRRMSRSAVYGIERITLRAGYQMAQTAVGEFHCCVSRQFSCGGWLLQPTRVGVTAKCSRSRSPMRDVISRLYRVDCAAGLALAIDEIRLTGVGVPNGFGFRAIRNGLPFGRPIMAWCPGSPYSEYRYERRHADLKGELRGRSRGRGAVAAPDPGNTMDSVRACPTGLPGPIARL